MTISVYNIAKAPLGWAVYCDGAKTGGVFVSKDAAFEAASMAASVAIQSGTGVQVNVPDTSELKKPAAE
jgi:hypothetical protein